MLKIIRKLIFLKLWENIFNLVACFKKNTCAECSLHLSNVLKVILHIAHVNTSSVVIVFEELLLILSSRCFLV